MKKLQKKVVVTMAKASKKVAKMTANSACVCWMYQPQMPDAVKKLRKF